MAICTRNCDFRSSENASLEIMCSIDKFTSWKLPILPYELIYFCVYELLICHEETSGDALEIAEMHYLTTKQMQELPSTVNSEICTQWD